MNTLKLKLLAASMFAFTAAANAQTYPGATPARTFSPSPNSPSTTAGTRSAYTGGSNDSYIGQQGGNQFAQVDQTGGFGGNTADIYQIITPSGTASNNAFQTQNNNGFGGSGARNIARIDQLGINSSSTQTQDGSGQYAYTYQGENTDNNTAVQNQTSNSNSGYAYIGQTGKGSYASQSQSGGGYNEAKIIQSSNSSTAIQEQIGNQNRASTMQLGVDSYSQIQQNGEQNKAFVTQR